MEEALSLIDAESFLTSSVRAPKPDCMFSSIWAFSTRVRKPRMLRFSESIWKDLEAGRDLLERRGMLSEKTELMRANWEDDSLR